MGSWRLAWPGFFRYNRQMTAPSRLSVPVSRPRPRVLVVGGLSRLQHHYRDCLSDVRIDVANVNSPRLKNSIGAADAVLVVVPHVSHAAADRVRRQAHRHGVPVVRAASSGVGEVSRLIRELIHNSPLREEQFVDGGGI